jgi:preprotein translocase subunit YajC
MTEWVTHAVSQTAPGAGGIFSMLIMFVPMIIIMYFLMIRPESQKRKKLEGYVASLKRGDEVVLTSGIFGKILAIEERFIQLEIADKVRIRVLKQSVTGAAQQFLGGEQKAVEADKSKSE